MRTTIEINDELLFEAQKLSGITDKRTLIEKALQLYVAFDSQKKLSGLRGMIEFDEGAIK